MSCPGFGSAHQHAWLHPETELGAPGSCMVAAFAESCFRVESGSLCGLATSGHQPNAGSAMPRTLSRPRQAASAAIAVDFEEEKHSNPKGPESPNVPQCHAPFHGPVKRPPPPLPWTSRRKDILIQRALKGHCDISPAKPMELGGVLEAFVSYKTPHNFWLKLEPSADLLETLTTSLALY
ncbi:uncharacterized protein LOC144143490 [Haemaphysalis longicornis]